MPRDWAAWGCSAAAVLFVAMGCGGATESGRVGACVDLMTDASHCGACGLVCAAGQYCAQGVCDDAAG